MSKISVIMPCYQTKEELLTACVESILAQTFEDFELIIVDDGSTEEYRSIYRKALFSDARIHVELGNNAGVSAARNHGLTLATGDYVVYVDSDDLLLPNFFAEAVAVAEQEQADLVYGCNMRLSDQVQSTTRAMQPGDIETYSAGSLETLRPSLVGKLRRYGDGSIYIGRGPWTRLVRRALAQAVTFPENLAIGEDIVWNLKLLKRCEKVCIVQRAWYLYRVDNLASATKRYNPQVIEESKAGLYAVKEQLNLNHEEEYKAFAWRCLEELNRIYHSYLGHKQCTLSKSEKKQQEEILYRQEPWCVIREKRYQKLVSRKEKVLVFLCKHKLYFTYLSWKKK